MKRLHLFQHDILLHLWLLSYLGLPICGCNTLQNNWKSTCHNYFWSELCGVIWISFGSASCNRILEMIHLRSLILNIFSILIGKWSPSSFTLGENSNDTELFRVPGAASLSTRCDTSLVCHLCLLRACRLHHRSLIERDISAHINFLSLWSHNL